MNLKTNVGIFFKPPLGLDGVILFVAYAPLGALRANDDGDDTHHLLTTPPAANVIYQFDGKMNYRSTLECTY